MKRNETIQNKTKFRESSLHLYLPFSSLSTIWFQGDSTDQQQGTHHGPILLCVDHSKPHHPPSPSSPFVCPLIHHRPICASQAGIVGILASMSHHCGFSFLTMEGWIFLFSSETHQSYYRPDYPSQNQNLNCRTSTYRAPFPPYPSPLRLDLVHAP